MPVTLNSLADTWSGKTTMIRYLAYSLNSLADTCCRTRRSSILLLLLSQFLGGYLPSLLFLWERGISLSIPWRILDSASDLSPSRQFTLNSLADTWAETPVEQLEHDTYSQFLGGYLLVPLLCVLAVSFCSQFLGGYLDEWNRDNDLVWYSLNSLADTCEGLYSCYIRIRGIYVYPPLELKYPVLKNRVDQRT